jgi:hypothetical protein
MNWRNVTTLQWIGIIILFNTTLLGGASQLADLALSIVAVKAILAFATLGNGFLGGLVTMFGGSNAQAQNVIADPQAQGTLVKAVSRMPGIDPLHVNAQANATVAALALDPANEKIDIAQGATAAIQAIAKAG